MIFYFSKSLFYVYAFPFFWSAKLKKLLSKQGDILIQMKVGEVYSNDSQQVCIALKWLKLRGKCSGGPFWQHILRTESLYLDWTC